MQGQIPLQSHPLPRRSRPSSPARVLELILGSEFVGKLGQARPQQRASDKEKSGIAWLVLHPDRSRAVLRQDRYGRPELHGLRDRACESGDDGDGGGGWMALGLDGALIMEPK
jgi:hypothetical protein